MSLATLPMLFPILLIGVLQWLMPSMTPRTVQFGVRIPAAHLGEPVIGRQRRRYRIGVVAVTAVAVAAALTDDGRAGRLAVTVILEAVATAGLYLIARKRIAAAKAEAGWFEGLRQVAVADTTLRTAPEPFPWRWAVPSAVVVAATVVTGILRYPSLPQRIAVHYGLSGRADRFTHTSVVSAFALVFIQVVTTGLMYWLARVSLHAKAQLDAEDPAAGVRQRRFAAAIARGLLLLTLGANVTFLLGSLRIWGIITDSGPATVLVYLTPTLLGTLGLVGIAIRTGQGGSRLSLGTPQAAASGRPKTVNRDDDRLYKLGLFYYNPDDPAFFVPKRFGVGWTVNMAKPAAWVLAAVTIALIAVALVAPWTLKR